MSDVSTTPDPTHYAYRVIWSAEDDEFVGLCAEFPSLSWLSENQTEAFLGIQRVVRDVVRDMVAEGEQIPRPLSERSYSGKFMTRVSPDLHARLAREAAEQHVSLNRLVTERLSTPLSAPAKTPFGHPDTVRTEGSDENSTPTAHSASAFRHREWTDEFMARVLVPGVVFWLVENERFDQTERKQVQAWFKRYQQKAGTAPDENNSPMSSCRTGK
ncbi:HicB family protein [Nocardia nova SH22a]|uniref:HicB family protein n=1 Tax=Nocardia nova SH22a TaxID=1415166 RepID=W5TQK4_9NOCA|nr:HicB family protein [Nocardia nova SH22a]